MSLQDSSNVKACRHHGVRTAILVLGLLSLIVLGFCNTAACAKRWNLIGHTMAKGLNSQQSPVGAAAKFSTNDETALSWFEVEFLDFGPVITTKRVTFSWRWYESTDILYRQQEKSADLTLRQPRSFWDEIKINGGPAERKTGEWRVEVYVDEELLLEERFRIEPAKTFLVRLTVWGLDSTYRTNVRVDGVFLDRLTDGDVRRIELEIGMLHNISVDTYVSGRTGERFACFPNEILASVAMDISFIYEMEYRLTVVSEHGSPRGEGWYRKGSAATFSVTSPSSGGVGIQFVFQRWIGDFSSTSTSATVIMDGSRNVTAVWAADYTQLYLVIVIACLFVLGTVVLPTIRRWRAHQASHPRKSTEPSKKCPICGKEAVFIPKATRYYCPDCKRYV